MIREIKKEEIAELIQKVDELGRYLTNHPEVSGEEKESCEYITQFLKKEGYEITAPYGEMPYSFRAVDKEKNSFMEKKRFFYVNMMRCRKWGMLVGILTAAQSVF